ncbi:MAG: VanZ family protein [Lachnospiraceae bacterium]|nr:VanZ family protein [Lachnospiraceae bacterium]
MKSKETNSLGRIGGILLVLYLALLIYFLLFSSSFGRNPGFSEHRYNLIPFREIQRFYHYWKQVGLLSAVLNLAGNLVGFVPWGFLVPLCFKGMRSWKPVVLSGFFLTLVLELLQLYLKAGIFDVDDILLNTVGALLGYQIFWIFNRFRR